jgi:ArsR family transcriptional regulator
MLNATIATDPLILQGFHALSDPLRLQILSLLRQQELCVCDLCDRLEVRQSKLSFHLKTMKEAQLVQSRQDGKWTYYRLNRGELARLEQYLAEIRQHSPILPPRCCDENE